MHVEEVLDSNTVTLSWNPAKEREIFNYIVYYTLYSTHLKKTLDQFMKTITDNRTTSEVFHIPGADREHVEHIFHVSFKVQAYGEEFESEKTELIFNFGIKFGSCIMLWNRHV